MFFWTGVYTYKEPNSWWFHICSAGTNFRLFWATFQVHSCFIWLSPLNQESIPTQDSNTQRWSQALELNHNTFHFDRSEPWSNPLLSPIPACNVAKKETKQLSQVVSQINAYTFIFCLRLWRGMTRSIILVLWLSGGVQIYCFAH